VNNVPKSQIILYLQTDNFDELDGSYNYLLNMPIHTLTKEKYEELLSNEFQKQVELDEVKKKEPVQMYKSDLLDLKKSLSKIY
jgi:DNA topoisomerase-2